MKLIRPHYVLYSEGLSGHEILCKLEQIGRLSHQSVDKVSEGSAEKFIAKWAIGAGHGSILRHQTMTVRIICSRAVSHQLVRHGLADFMQESQRYCRYNGHVQFVIPEWIGDKIEPGEYTEESQIKLTPPSSGARVWIRQMFQAEQAYHDLLAAGRKPEEARGVLPNDAKTEIYITANLEEWRHIFKARTSKHADPATREIMIPVLEQAKNYIPVVFDDIEPYRDSGLAK